MENLEKISDNNLYQLCRDFGARALEWRRKFAGLLPEVYRRRLYEKKGFPSIFVFAKKLAGMSEEQVRVVLNLERRFTELPILRNLLVNGEVSVNKLARVVSVANMENQGFLAENLKVLSNRAVETWMKDEKWAAKNEGNSTGTKSRNALFESKNDDKSLHVHSEASLAETCQSGRPALNLSEEVQEKLLELQNKGIDINQLLLEFLQKREEEIVQRKEEISRKVLQKEKERKQVNMDISEYILEKPAFLKPRSHVPVSVKRILKEEYGTKCAVPHCQKPAEQIHHELPFAIGRSHDPKFMVPLCRAHHELEHAVNVNYGRMRMQSG